MKYGSYLRDEVHDNAWLEAQLYLLAFATGMQDATAFPDYRCFASNQTGNTVLLAVGVFRLGGDIFRLANIGISLTLFIAGVALFGQLGNLLGVRTRWWLVASSLLQTLLVFAAAALQYRYGVSADGPLTQLIIALLAVASGAGGHGAGAEDHGRHHCHGHGGVYRSVHRSEGAGAQEQSKGSAAAVFAVSGGGELCGSGGV